MERVHLQFVRDFLQFVIQNDGSVQTNICFGGFDLINKNLAIIYQLKRNFMSTYFNVKMEKKLKLVSFHLKSQIHPKLDVADGVVSQIITLSLFPHSLTILPFDAL